MPLPPPPSSCGPPPTLSGSAPPAQPTPPTTNPILREWIQFRVGAIPSKLPCPIFGPKNIF